MATYRTKDFSLAAFLMTKGFPINVVPLSPNQREFRFPPDAEREVSAFYTDAIVSAKAYAAAFRELKSIIYNNPTANSFSTESINVPANRAK